VRIKRAAIFALKIYSIVLFEYRTKRLRRDSKIKLGDLVRVVSEKSAPLSLRCPDTGEQQNKSIQSGDICVFMGTIHQIKVDNFPRAVILHDGMLSFISNYRKIEYTLEKIE
jgi:hypothetical protein